MIKSRKGQEGFTLIELLVVVLIIGILAAIAIPAFLGQKKGAQDSNAKSLLRNAAIAMESHYSGAQDFAGFTTANINTSTGMKAIEPNIEWELGTAFAAKAVDDEVSVTIGPGTVNAATNDAYVLETESASGNQFRYDRDDDASVLKCKGNPLNAAAITACTSNQW